LRGGADAAAAGEALAISGLGPEPSRGGAAGVGFGLGARALTGGGCGEGAGDGVNTASGDCSSRGSPMPCPCRVSGDTRDAAPGGRGSGARRVRSELLRKVFGFTSSSGVEDLAGLGLGFRRVEPLLTPGASWCARRRASAGEGKAADTSTIASIAAAGKGLGVRCPGKARGAAGSLPRRPATGGWGALGSLAPEVGPEASVGLPKDGSAVGTAVALGLRLSGPFCWASASAGGESEEVLPRAGGPCSSCVCR
jgi:hypothetical protein